MSLRDIVIGVVTGILYIFVLVTSAAVYARILNREFKTSCSRVEEKIDELQEFILKQSMMIPVRQMDANVDLL